MAQRPIELVSGLLMITSYTEAIAQVGVATGFSWAKEDSAIELVAAFHPGPICFHGSLLSSIF